MFFFLLFTSSSKTNNLLKTDDARSCSWSSTFPKAETKQHHLPPHLTVATTCSSCQASPRCSWINAFKLRVWAMTHGWSQGRPLRVVLGVTELTITVRNAIVVFITGLRRGCYMFNQGGRYCGDIPHCSWTAPSFPVASAWKRHTERGQHLYSSRDSSNSCNLSQPNAINQYSYFLHLQCTILA